MVLIGATLEENWINKGLRKIMKRIQYERHGKRNKIATSMEKQS